MSPHRAQRDHLDARLLRRYARSPRSEVPEALVLRFAPLARSVAREYAGRGEAFEDLLQVANVGLLLALRRFDPWRGHRFASFAAPTIRGELRRHFRDRFWPVHVPRSVKELDERRRGTEVRMERSLGRRPSDTELAEELGVPRRELDEARRARNAFRSVAHTDGDAAHHALAVEERGYERVDRRDLVLRGLRRLEQRDRFVVGRFLEGRRQHEIGRELGVSQVHVSRLLRGAAARMRDPSRSAEDSARTRAVRRPQRTERLGGVTD